ncbi:hypothetical protein DEJ23_14505 [Curtobacterium sp. MCSS17_008]|uniref:hypothetical protein n=1 Tax=Curtobacterium sp. MCSS17_008 TaxID=2175647 RepID=UPI000DA6E0D8|nr:hypothetical protein [Curtobacterium sp. MCSS17_008]PZF53349.1 hypothetical protein DEJ23_14505 [Curtobacterium sp. MCSS17_008]
MPDTTPTGPEPTAGRAPAVLALLVVVGLEALALVVVTVVLLVESIVAPSSSIASAIALTLLSAIAALWLVSLVVGLSRRRPWVRSGIIVWQVLQGALAIGAFQGVFRVAWVGWVLLVPALLGLTLVLSRAVTGWLVPRDARDEG